MKLTAIITTLVLGSSSIALADPMIRDHRDARPVYAPQPLTWVSLANNTQLNGRTQIQVGQTHRQFTKLAIRTDGNGRTAIDKVMIVFGNGRSQTVNLDVKLTKQSPSVTIDLAGNSRNISRIVLVGKSKGRNSSVDVVAI